MKPIKNKALFYLLSFTWGLPLNILGLITALILIICKKSPEKYSHCYYFEVGHKWGGLEMGVFFLVNENPSQSLLNHELGHAVQNCYFGFLMPFLVSIPSAIRYWIRRKKGLSKKGNSRKEYDSIWFEAQATRLGDELVNQNGE